MLIMVLDAIAFEWYQIFRHPIKGQGSLVARVSWDNGSKDFVSNSHENNDRFLKIAP